MEGLPRRPSLGVSILAVGVITPTLCLSQAGKRGLWWIYSHEMFSSAVY